MIRMYLRYIDEYVMYDLEPARYTHLDVDCPEVQRLLQSGWHVAAVQQVPDEPQDGGEE